MSYERKVIKISELEANKGQIEGLPKNPRLIKDERFKKLVQSIKDSPEFIELRELIVIEHNGKFVVIAGNQRLSALKELKIKEAPCKVLSDGTSIEKLKEYTIKDNVSFGEMDWEIIDDEWGMEDLESWGQEIIDNEDKKELLDPKDDNFEIPDITDPITKQGDVIEIGKHRLVCMDSTTMETYNCLFGNKLADMVVTDPPYNIDYEGKTKDKLKIQNDKKEDSDFFNFLFNFYSNLNNFVQKGGAWYVWHADRESINFRQAFIDAGILLKQNLIWAKSSMCLGRQDYQWRHEPCLYGWKEGAAHKWYSDRKQTTILEFKKPNENRDHPTMKPVELIAYQITNSSKEGDIVADGFLGSGTTMVASHQLNRICYGVEIDPFYCDVIVKRMIVLDPSLPVLVNGEDLKHKYTTINE